MSNYIISNEDKDELDRGPPADILTRLRGYNQPDRTSDGQRQIAADIQEAADEIERLRKYGSRYCSSCGELLNGNCDRCQRLWES